MKTSFYLHPHLKKYFKETESLFSQLMALHGIRFREQKGRLTQRIVLGEKSYFIKQHRGVGFKEIIKNLLQGKIPIVSAKNEWLAIHKLKSLNIATPHISGYGERGVNPASKQSFVLMEEITDVISLEDFCKDWHKKPPSFTLKYHLIKETARIAAILHKNGINHRDFYICHFLLNPHTLTLYLIDLHRAQIRRKTPKRWIIKDLAGLYFSSIEIGLTRHDVFRFIKFYHKTTLRDIVTVEKRFWEQVKKRGEQLYRDNLR